jgi:hypothetical protein
VIHVKLRDSRGPCRDYVGILICFVKNNVIHVKLRDSRKTTWFIKNSLITSCWKKSPRSFVTFSSVGIDTIDIHEKHDLNWEIIDYNNVPTLCFLCVDSILSLQARKQYLWVTRGFMKTPGFRFPPLSWRIDVWRPGYYCTLLLYPLCIPSLLEYILTYSLLLYIHSKY